MGTRGKRAPWEQRRLYASHTTRTTPCWRVAVHRKLPEGNTIFEKWEYVTTQPTYDTHSWDVTNGEWFRVKDQQTQ